MTNKLLLVCRPNLETFVRQGTNARFAHTHIETLRKQNTLPKEYQQISRVWLKGRQFHYTPLHIEVLTKQTTLFKNLNKARSEGAK